LKDESVLNSDDPVVTVRVRDVSDLGVVARTEEAIRRVFPRSGTSFPSRQHAIAFPIWPPST